MASMLCIGAGGAIGVEGMVHNAWAAGISNAGTTSIEASESGAITVTGDLTISGVGSGSSPIYTVDGSSTISGSLELSKASVTTSLTLQVASTLCVGETTSIGGGTNLTVQSGGMYVAGSEDYTWVTEEMVEAGLSSSASSFAIFATYTAYNASTNTGTLNVGTTSSTSDVNFGSDSLFVVDAQDLGSNYALTASTITVESGASLLVSNVKFAEDDTATVYIAKANSTEGTALSIADDAWGYDASGTTYDTDYNTSTGTSTISEASSNSLYFDNAFTSGEVTYEYSDQSASSGGHYILNLTKLDSNDVLPLLDPSLADHINDASDLPSYIDEASLISDKKEAAATIEGAAKMSVGAGVLASLSAANELGACAVANRSSLTAVNPANATIVQKPLFLAASDSSFTDTPMPLIADAATESGLVNGLAIWMQPLFQSVSADGFTSGNFEYGYDTDIFGVSLGADYTMDKSIRLGLAFHMGSGDTESSHSDFSHTENDFDYFGATIYGAYVVNNFSISADMGYIVTTNDVVQQSSIGELTTGDFDAGAFSLGARAQYKVVTDFVDIVPYLGARLNYCHIESFTTKDSLGTVFYNHDVDATTFGVPLGITVAKTMDFDSFTLTPRAKLGVQFTMGDLDVAQRVSLPNVSGHATMESEVFDPVTFMGGLGLDFGMDNMSFALEYNIGASQNVTSHQVMGTVSYKF